MQHLLIQILFIVGISLLSFGDSYAQAYNFSTNKIGLDDGLSSYNVNEITQDDEGFIWISTDYGLNRFDGQQVKSYTKEENGLCGNNIIYFAFDNNGMAWVGSQDNNKGRCYSILDPITDKIYTLEEYLGTSLPFEGQNILISPIFYQNSILFSFLNPNQKNYSTVEFNGSNFIPILENLDWTQFPNHIYHGNVHKINNDKYVLILYSKNEQQYSTLIIIADAAGNILERRDVSSDYKFIDFRFSKRQAPYSIYFDGDKEERTTLHIYPINNHEATSIESRSTTYRFTTFSNNKIYTVDSDSVIIYNTKGERLSQAKMPIPLSYSNNVFFIDRDENIWLSNNQQVYYLTPQKQLFTTELDHLAPPVRARGLYENAFGHLYIGSIGSLFQKKEGQWDLISENHKSQLHNVLAIYAEKDSLWVGLEEGKLLCYKLPSFEIDYFNSLVEQPNNAPSLIWSIHRSENKILWLGTTNGLFYVENETKSIVPFDSTRTSLLSRTEILAFHENKQGLWLATSNGLYNFDPNQNKILGHYASNKKADEYLPAMQIAHFHEDKNGIFWLATKGDGLIRWNPKTGAYKQYTQKGAGLSHNILYAVYEDDFNNLWISSQRGLMSFHKPSEHIQVYLEEDGLPHNEFNTISHFKAKNGKLFFGGQNGLIHFHPKEIVQDSLFSALIVTGYYKQDIETDSIVQLTHSFLNTDIIQLTPNDKMFQLNFALLNYNNPQNHQYSYQIIGYDKDWNYLNKGQVQINGLPYGEYELRLRGKASNSSTWQDYPQSIKILVLRPFYFQIWFVITALFVIVLLIYIGVKYRIYQLKEREKELETIVKERTAKIELDKQVIKAQAEELQALDKIKSRFFANISHELRTPLTLILGPLSYILDDESSWEKESIKRQLLTMQRNGKSLINLIEEILDLSKIEANKLELIEEATPVKQYFEHTYSSFSQQLANQNINSTIYFNLYDEHLTTLLDRKKLEKIINNFLSNAIKFTPHSGTINLYITEKDKSIEIKVEDTGQGIHPKDLPHVFERFFQSKQANRKLYGGTGIGLALVSEFASLMEGRVSVESIWGGGSTFFFEFPKKIVSTQYTALKTIKNELEEQVIESVGSKFTILIVEDNEDMRSFISQLLKTKYKEVLVAENGAVGLRILKERASSIHLIISDVMMPEMDGLSMLQTIKSTPEWSHLPIIMVTALAEERDKLNALTIGVDDYITKPFSSTELLVRVQNLLYNYHQRLQSQAEFKNEAKGSIPNDSKDIISPISNNDKKWLDEVEQTITESMLTGIVSVEELAKKLFISKRQLSRKIKPLIGLSPSKFIREIQLNQGRTCLENGSFISISEVAFKVGFDNPSTFSTLFKKRFGKSPSEYIK